MSSRELSIEMVGMGESGLAGLGLRLGIGTAFEVVVGIAPGAEGERGRVAEWCWMLGGGLFVGRTSGAGKGLLSWAGARGCRVIWILGLRLGSRMYS